jgi:hypothetical protein
MLLSSSVLIGDAMRTPLRLLACLALAAFVGGCGGPTSSGLAAPSAGLTAASPSIEPTTAASPVAPTPSAGSADRFEPDSIATVLEGPLRMRSRPRIAEDSIKFDPLLPSGERLFVVDGPVRASEYEWYLVVPFDIWSGSYNIGWVAAADHDGTPWLRAADAACRSDPTLTDLTAMHYLDALSCYPSRDFTFTNTLSLVGCGDGGFLASPGWMCGRYSWGMPEDGLRLALSPDLVDPGEFHSAELTITARLDDPAAKTCIAERFEAETDYELLSARVLIECRAMFVGSSVSPAT